MLCNRPEPGPSLASRTSAGKERMKDERGAGRASMLALQSTIGRHERRHPWTLQPQQGKGNWCAG